MKITVVGAARTVTGSCYHIQTKDVNILVDCGAFQGTRDNEKRNVSPFPFKASEIQYLLLTHAHLDHSGLIPKGKLNSLRIFVDSPLALQATRITVKHPECLDKETLALIKEENFFKNTPIVKFTESVEDSIEINKIKSGAIIISSSGMCEAGRIRHHLKHNLWRSECSVIFVGFQAQGTLGRKIVEGDKKVRIFGEEIAVKARVYTIGGLSAHADRDELLDWLSKFKKKPQRVFIIHGEENTALGFAETVQNQLNLDAYVPSALEEIQIL
ncbi:MAG: MBL fold metallo-hydrolase RNA specificity domain-containing protein [Candidatus Brocadia sp.]